MVCSPESTNRFAIVLKNQWKLNATAVAVGERDFSFLSLGFEDDHRGRFRGPIARGYENGNCNFQGFVDGEEKSVGERFSLIQIVGFGATRKHAQN